ncbi:hypothetical protein V8C37DRAFT_366123 [Trichoderma ceciliae]
MAFCTPCNRVFKDDEALSMHLQGSRAHQEPTLTTAPLVFIWKCVRCDLDFGSRDELRLHILVSERHFVCGECVGDGEWLDFLTERALKSHFGGRHRMDAMGLRAEGVEKSDESNDGVRMKKDKKDKKKRDRACSTSTRQETPLDRFFTSFAGFPYDPHLSPEASLKLLEQDQGWESRKHGPAKDAWKRYQRALVKEVEMWFGDEDDLTAWWTLCKAVGHCDPPEDVRMCKAILRNTHVNIVDLIDWGRRRGGEDEASSIEVFRSVEELRKYTLDRDKVFAMRELKEYKGGNVVLRHLLRHLLEKGRGQRVQY